MERPHRRYIFAVTIEADSMDDVEYALTSMARDGQTIPGPFMSAGYAVSWHGELKEDTEMTGERFRREIVEYGESLKTDR